MKRLTIRVLIAALAFLIGTAAVYLWLIRRPHPPTSGLPDIEKVNLDTGRPTFIEVFHDFEYVGAVPLVPSVAPHGIDVQPLPANFEPGWQYIFHRRNPTDDDSLFAELQERLRAKGIAVLDAQGRVYGYIDGLHFHIAFREGVYQGRIENRLDQQVARSPDASVRKRLFVDDYILTVGAH